MTGTKTIFFLVFLLSFLAVSSICVLGLGASPARATLNYIPNAVYQGKVCYTTGGFPILRAEAVGEYADYVKFLTVDENNEFDGTLVCLNYSLTMPPSMSRPGKNRIAIRVVEVPPEDIGGMIVAVVSIESQIDIVAPYPGKYLEITDFSAQNVNAGDNLPITIAFVNHGNETVEKVQGRILFYDKNNRVVGSLSTKEYQNIEPNQDKKLLLYWNSSGNREGNYHALCELLYDDGLKSNATMNFKLGGLDVNLIDYTNEIIVGGLREFHATVDSVWSETVTGVRANVSVYNLSRSPEPLQIFETLTRDIPPWGSADLKGYIDTTNLSLGVYDLKITLFFEGMRKDYDKNLSVIKQPEPKKAKTSKGLFASSLTVKIVMGLLVLLLIAMIIILVSLFIPKKKQKEDEKKDKQLSK